MEFQDFGAGVKYFQMSREVARTLRKTGRFARGGYTGVRRSGCTQQTDPVYGKMLALHQLRQFIPLVEGEFLGAGVRGNNCSFE